MRISINHPTKAYISNYTPEELSSLKEQLTYENKTIKIELKKHKDRKYWLEIKDPIGFQERLDELKSKLKTTLVFEDEGGVWIRPGSIPYIKDIQLEVTNTIEYPKFKAIPWAKQIEYKPYPYQVEIVEKLMAIKHGNISAATGCHAKGTDILMYDGKRKKVEDIVIGDLLMGPDSKPRKVLNLHRGKDLMYKIIPIKGEPFIVNSEHVLSLQYTNKRKKYRDPIYNGNGNFKGLNRIENISVIDYLKLSKTKKHVLKLYRTGVEFNHNNSLHIPPYILGLWLGDGASGQCTITTMDEEIKEEWCNYIEKLGLKISIVGRTGVNKKSKASNYSGILYHFRPFGRAKSGESKVPRQNHFLIELDKYGLVNNKHIPYDYLTASREDRLKLLAGLIDTDGSLESNCFEIIQKNRQLADDIIFLARSLGYRATSAEKESKCQTGVVGTYVRIIISGNTNEVPTRLGRKKATPRSQKKNVLRTGFSITKVGIDDYYGFEVDGDNLYLMGDFTVTHNSGKTLCLLMLCQKMGLSTLVVTPSQSIFSEILREFQHRLGTGVVGGYGDGKKDYKKKITVAIGKSLTTLKPDSDIYKTIASKQVILCDEAHAWAASMLEDVCHGVCANIPYRLFASATVFRNDGTTTLLESIVGKEVFNFSIKDAIYQGYLCPLGFKIVTVSSPSRVYKKDPIECKRVHFLYNPKIAELSAKIANGSWLLKQESTLILVEELRQIKMLKDLLKVPFGYVHAGSKKEAAEWDLEQVDVQKQIEAFNRGETRTLIGTRAISTGTNIFATHNTINWVGGSSPIVTMQGAMGRSTRKLEISKYKDFHKPKLYSMIYDFDVEDQPLLEYQLQERIKCYKLTGVDPDYF